MKKILKVLGITMILCMILTSFCFAAIDIPEPDSNVSLGEAEGLATTALGLLQTVGIFIAVGMAIFLGIKYVASSPEGKSELKKQLGIYVLGIVLILSASMIVGAVASAMGK